MSAAAAALRRTEAKAFFANERTFLHWMNMSVTLGSIAAALLGVSGVAHKSWGKGYEHHAAAVRGVATLVMCLAIFMAGYAAKSFVVRGNMLMCGRGSGRWGRSFFSLLAPRRAHHASSLPPPLVFRNKADGPYDSRVLPVLLACVLIACLTLVFGGAVAELAGW